MTQRAYNRTLAGLAACWAMTVFGYACIGGKPTVVGDGVAAGAVAVKSDMSWVMESLASELAKVESAAAAGRDVDQQTRNALAQIELAMVRIEARAGRDINEPVTGWILAVGSILSPFLAVFGHQLLKKWSPRYYECNHVGATERRTYRRKPCGKFQPKPT